MFTGDKNFVLNKENFIMTFFLEVFGKWLNLNSIRSRYAYTLQSAYEYSITFLEFSAIDLTKILEESRHPVSNGIKPFTTFFIKKMLLLDPQIILEKL